MMIWIVAFPAYLAKREAYKRPIIKSGGALDDIQKLADLRATGILTASEFEIKKQELLKRI